MKFQRDMAITFVWSRENSRAKQCFARELFPAQFGNEKSSHSLPILDQEFICFATFHPHDFWLEWSGDTSSL